MLDRLSIILDVRAAYKLLKEKKEIRRTDLLDTFLPLCREYNIPEDDILQMARGDYSLEKCAEIISKPNRGTDYAKYVSRFKMYYLQNSSAGYIIKPHLSVMFKIGDNLERFFNYSYIREGDGTGEEFIKYFEREILEVSPLTLSKFLDTNMLTMDLLFKPTNQTFKIVFGKDHLEDFREYIDDASLLKYEVGE